VLTEIHTFRDGMTVNGFRRSRRRTPGRERRVQRGMENQITDLRTD